MKAPAAGRILQSFNWLVIIDVIVVVGVNDDVCTRHESGTVSMIILTEVSILPFTSVIVMTEVVV